MFNNFDLSDDEVLEIANQYENLINKYSRINGEIDEDLKHSEDAKKIVKRQREKKKFKQNLDDLVLREMHNQAALELSKNSKLSDMTYRNWNTSAYTYNKNKY